MPTSNGITTYLIVVYKEGNNEGKSSRKKQDTTDGSWPAEGDGLRAYSFPEYAHTTDEALLSGFAQGLFQNTFKIIKSSLAYQSKHTNLESPVAVYIPLLPQTIGFKIGFGFIPNFPEGIRFLARIKFNGTLVAQVCIKPQQQPNGVISRILADTPTGNKGWDAPTLQEFEFEFAPRSGIFKSTAEEGGDIEISWHRVLGSALSKRKDINRVQGFKERFQIKLKPAGEAVGVPQRKLYLVDPIDEPFASQKWYYRTARSLQESQIMSQDHDLYTQLPPIGDRGSLEYHVNRKARQNPEHQKRKISVAGPIYLNPGLSPDSSSAASVIHHDIFSTTQGARRYKSTKELKRSPGENHHDISVGGQAHSRRHSIAYISPSVGVGTGLLPITMGVAHAVLLPSPGSYRCNLNNGRHTGLPGQVVGLHPNDDTALLQSTSNDDDGHVPIVAPQPTRMNALYQHDNVQFGYGLSSSPIPDDDASGLSTVDGEFVQSRLTPAQHGQHALPIAPQTTPEQIQPITSKNQQTPGSPLDGVSYPVMTPGSHNLPVIEPGDTSGLSPEKADDTSPYKFPEKNVASGFSPEKDKTLKKQARSALLPYKSPRENTTSGLCPMRVESAATAAAPRIASDSMESSPVIQIQGSRMSAPISLSIPHQSGNSGHAANSESVPSLLGLAEVGVLGLQISGQLQCCFSEFGSQQQAPPLSGNSGVSSPRRLQSPTSFGGGVQRERPQRRGMMRSPSRTASLFKEGVASVRRQLGISESGASKASTVRGGDENADEGRLEGRESQKLTRRSPTVSKSPKHKDGIDGEYGIFTTNGAAVDAGVALGGSDNGGITVQSFGAAKNLNLAETAPSGSDHHVCGQRASFVSKFNTGAATSAALCPAAVDVALQNVSMITQASRQVVSCGVSTENSSRHIKRADGRDKVDADPISPITMALNGLVALGEKLELGQAFILREKKQKVTAVSSNEHAVEDKGKGKQKVVEKSVKKTQEWAAEKAEIRNAVKVASATAAPEANVTSQDAPRTPENNRPVSAAVRYPCRQSSLNQLKPRPLEDSPSLTIFGGTVGRANRHYYTNTPRSHADRARQEVHIQDQAQDHSHPPSRGDSHSHPSPPVVGCARLIDVPARFSTLRYCVPHGHPDPTPAEFPPHDEFDDLYDVTPPDTPRRRARQSALVPASVQGSPSRGANITAAGVQIRDASNAANLFRAISMLTPPAATPSHREARPCY